jgi:hypothetical protein
MTTSLGDFGNFTGPVLLCGGGVPLRVLSAKLVKHNKALHSEALTTAETYELARSQGYRPPQPRTTVPDSAVAGVAESMDVVIVA